MNVTAATNDVRALTSSHDVIDDDRLRWLLLGCATCLYLPMVAMGPGSNPDSIRELNSGAMLLWQHRYVMSRPPGYFPYELLCGLLYFFGGSIATNCATMAMSLMLLDSFLCICEKLEVPHRHLLAAALAIHPIYWTASTSTIDYIWALGCFFLGWRLMMNRRCLSAGALLGLAIGIRMASLLLVAPLIVASLAANPRERKLWLSAALACAVGAALYIPAYRVSGNSLAFLSYYAARWTLAAQLGRFTYKNVYFWGLPASAFLIAMGPTVAVALRRSAPKYRSVVAVCIASVTLIEVLFVKIPVQRAYLLPLLPFALILLGIALRDRVAILTTMALLLFSYNFVDVNLARADVPNHATRVTFGLFLEPGYLLTDITQRLAVRDAHF